MIVTGLILLVAYLCILLILLVGYYQLEDFVPNGTKEINRFSVIIPFRNESNQLPLLLESLLKLKFAPNHYELIFVNDASEDNSVALIAEYLEKSKLNWCILHSNSSSMTPKKEAISLGVAHANFDWIVTTDADCVVPYSWLSVLDDFIQKQNPKMVCGPVAISGAPLLIASFQKSETISLQGITMGGFKWNVPLMCNGANLAYSKEIFKKVGGFVGNDTIASGDDIFLMEKFRKVVPKGIAFLKNQDAIVTTGAESSWNAVIRQRIRWAAKTTKQDNWVVQLIGLIVFATNLWFVAGFLGLFFSQDGYSLYYLGFLLLKMLADVLFVRIVNSFFKTRLQWVWLLLNAAFYPFLSSGIAIRSLFGSYKWKGRHFKR